MLTTHPSSAAPSGSSMNDALPTFRFRLKKLFKDPHAEHFDHWKIPLRLVIFITQTDRCDGLFHMQYCMIPEDCHIVLFDFRANAASLVLDYGQTGKSKPIVRTPLEILEKSERLTVVEDSHPHNIVLYIKKLSEVCPPDITFVLVNITPDEETLEFVMSTRTLFIKHSMVDILEVMATTLPEDQQKRLKKLVHDCCLSLKATPENDQIYSRCFASQMALQKCDFPLGLLFSYLVRIRIFGLAPECPTANDRVSDPYGYRLISLIYSVQKEFLEKAVFMVEQMFRMRIPSLPPLPGEAEPKLPELDPGDTFETAAGFELVRYPKVLDAETNFISEFQMYCSTRHLPMPVYEDHTRTVPGENPLFAVSLTTHGRTFHTPPVYTDKKTAKSEATKVAMVELGFLRLSPKAARVLLALKDGERAHLLHQTPPDPAQDLIRAGASAPECNPVSVLGEFCSKRELAQPEYAFVTEEYGVSAITFRATATLGTHSAHSDSHPSKREAKRVAAEKLLKILETVYVEAPTPGIAVAAEAQAGPAPLPILLPTNVTGLTTPAPTATAAAAPAPASAEGTVDGFANYTAALNNYCQKKAMQLPLYSFIEVPGAIAVYKATCTISALNIEVESTEAFPSKKAAKNSAAGLAYIACKAILH